MKSFLGILCLVFYFESASSQTLYQIIGRSQDLRVSDTAPLLRALDDQDPAVRRRSALALANLQDSTAVPALALALGDEDAGVRAMAAFALGQIGSTTVLPPLLGRLGEEREVNVSRSILEALGKSGDSTTLQSVAAFADSAGDGELKAGGAAAMARLAVRGIKSRQGIRTALELSRDTDSRVREEAFYALMRMSPLHVDPQTLRSIPSYLQDRDAKVAMYAAIIVGRNKMQSMADLLAVKVLAHEDWRVRVNALKALAMFDSVQVKIVHLFRLQLNNPNEYLSLTALTLLPEVFRKAVVSSQEKDTLVQRLKAIVADTDSSSSWRRQGEAAVALAKISGPDANSFLVAELARSSRRLPKMIEAISSIPEPANLQILRYYISRNDPAVAVPSINGALALLSGMRNAGKVVRSDLSGDIQRRLFSDVTAIAATAADVLADSLFVEYADGGTVRLAAERAEKKGDADVVAGILHLAATIGSPDMRDLVERFTRNADRDMARAALLELRVPPNDSRWNAVRLWQKPKHTDYDWQLLDSIQQRPPVIEVRTSRGRFEIELYPREAPFTSLAFVRLVRRKYYDNLVFHRVVPNFVIQGGDPSGSGWGGPGYSLRTEVSLLHFDGGMVGMASSGRDTEGSQFFITHSPQPHLDGRYTVFGRVVHGMDIVDEIQLGDTIISMRITR